MKEPILMPVLSDTMQFGHLGRWLKKIGDKVQKGEAIAEIETDKATMTVEAFRDGYLSGPLAPEGSDIPVRQPIGYLVDSPEEVETGAGSGTGQPSSAQPATIQKTASEKQAPPAAPAPATPPAPKTPPAPEAERAAVPQAAPSAVSPPPSPPPGASGQAVSPYARALAMDLGIDISQVPAGKDGQVRAVEVIAFAVTTMAPLPDLDAGPPYTIQPLSSIRKAVARNMMATLRTPMFRTSIRVSLKPLRTLSEKSDYSFTLLLARLAALAVKEHPLFNAVYTPQGLAQRQRVDMAIAVDTGDGLVTPVLRDMAEAPLDELAEAWRILEGKAKRKRLAPEDYRGGTFYISNLGVFPHIVAFDAIVPLGASAILAVAAEQRNGAVLTLTCDHRVLFGADAARFLDTLSRMLAHPQKRLALATST